VAWTLADLGGPGQLCPHFAHNLPIVTHNWGELLLCVLPVQALEKPPPSHPNRLCKAEVRGSNPLGSTSKRAGQPTAGDNFLSPLSGATDLEPVRPPLGLALGSHPYCRSGDDPASDTEPGNALRQRMFRSGGDRSRQPGEHNASASSPSHRWMAWPWRQTRRVPGQALSTTRKSVLSLTSRLVRTSEPRRLQIRSLGSGKYSYQPFAIVTR
jgi:hypothetical protein